MTLLEAIGRQTGENAVRLHTPGHSGKRCALPFGLFLDFDLTELPGIGSLYDGFGPIRQSEQKAERLFGTRRTLFSAGGCTLCIQTMLALAVQSGVKQILFSRNLHRSVINTAALLDITPRFMYPENGRITPAVLETALTSNPEAGAVTVTSPDYYGRISDIAGLKKVCKKFSVPLFVDNAHGSHLWCFGIHPTALGADMCADSPHKTLPVLTGGAWLHINNPAFERAKQAEALFGSTSPSFPVLASLEMCVDWLAKEGKQAFVTLAGKTAYLYEFAKKIGFGVFGGGGESDPVRLTLDANPLGYTGTQAAEILAQNGAQAEFADHQAVVMILTPFHRSADLARLKKALMAVRQKKPVYTPEIPFIQAKTALTPRQALLAKNRSVPVKNAVGKIAAQAVCPCPPGIPIVIPGEQISPEAVDAIFEAGIGEVNIICV
ncbi:MAG: aminotransferase class I/II-fold pyridoxal phosphate-dependent enzyme [Oscillospiraceae bacterium]|jgi:arginine/lysine/ornithine decarboxylase|nr:aminotransferase class I/II-fold pyridoxal phosphate-dependent enzyme [Oscillospiraceae bacterium]